jgi:hypothetical protein
LVLAHRRFAQSDAPCGIALRVGVHLPIRFTLRISVTLSISVSKRQPDPAERLPFS